MRFNRKAGTQLPGAKANPRQRHTPGEMNGAEQAYSQLLDLQIAAGTILAWWFESWKFRLGDLQAWYTPDFMVMKPDGSMEVHEVKGHMEEAALLRLKLMRSLYPFPLWLIHYKTKSVKKVREYLWDITLYEVKEEPE